MVSRTKGFAITVKQHGDLTGYIVAETAGQAKSKTVTSSDGDIKFTDITSCRRVPELDGRSVSQHCYSSKEGVPS